MSSVKEQETLTPQASIKKRRSNTRTLAHKASGPTGPRTQRGKMKSRYNALKHGIFANVVLRGSALREKKADYDNLLESFRESLQPEGGLEEFLVEKLAQIAWRKARAIRAEAGMIMKQTEFLRQDREAGLKRGSEGAMLQLARFGGIVRKRNNPYMLAKALELLDALRGLIRHRGFDLEEDTRLLQVLYGEFGETEELHLAYSDFSGRALAALKQSPPDEGAVEDCKQCFFREIEGEKEKLIGTLADLEAREEKELPLLEESLAIPEEKELERLLRYEARLDGTFDRTLQQLERLQRMRLGQPMPPTVKVDVTR